MNILINNMSQTPIYEQLKDQLRQSIVGGELKPKDMLPSIRMMAHDLSIGIITVKRAYDDLCTEGLLVSLQGRGVFVAEFDRVKLHNICLEKLTEQLKDIKRYCDASAITRAEMQRIMDQICEEDVYETDR